eukprot:gene26490-32014_t
MSSFSLLAVFVCFYVFSGTTALSPTTSSDGNPPDFWTYQRSETVDLCPYMKICESLFMLESNFSYFVHSRLPVYMDQSHTSHWNARNWDIETWAETTWPVMYDVLEMDIGKEQRVEFDGSGESSSDESSSPSPFLIYDIDTSQTPPFRPFTVIDEMFTTQFLSDIHNNRSVCRYVNTNFRVLEELAHITNDTYWRDLILTESDVDDEIAQSVAPIFHFLYPQCSVQSRYSEYHTMRLQLHGSSMLYIYAPNKVTSQMKLFPYFHPSAYQSPLDSHNKQYPLHTQEALVHKTAPGEIVYIPPGYMVYTEASTPSMYVDVHSISSEQKLYTESLSVQIPWYAYNLTEMERVVYTQVFLVHVLSRVYGVTSMYQYGRKLYKSRYQALYPLESVLVQNNEFKCYKDNPQYDNIIKKMNRDEIERTASYVAQKFNDIHKIAGKDVKWILLGNYVEQIMGWAYQKNPSLLNLALFLKECLDMKAKIEVIEEVLGPTVIQLEPQEV